MEGIALGLPLIGLATYFVCLPSRAKIWNTIAAWAAANRDAALVRQARRREYLGAAVPEVQSNG